MSLERTVHPGALIADKYRVENTIGKGGMGVVVSAIHEDLRERRALKFLVSGDGWNQEAEERFFLEARAAGRLQSPHCARVYDVGRHDGVPFMVMEFLEGRDLDVVLSEQKLLPAREATSHIVQAIDAIAEAHAKRVIHRDIKPSNLFLTTGVDGTPHIKVLDFGISKFVDPTYASLSLTEASALMGSPRYMSPEQMRSTRDVDTRTDIWSLGVCLFQLLSGRMPFQGETITQLCLAITHNEAPDLGLVVDVDPDLAQVIGRCLQKEPDGRYQNVAELSLALAPFGPPEATALAARAARTLHAAKERGSRSSAPPRTLPRNDLDVTRCSTPSGRTPSEPLGGDPTVVEGRPSALGEPTRADTAAPAVSPEGNSSHAAGQQSLPPTAPASRRFIAVGLGAAVVGGLAAVLVIRPGEPTPAAPGPAQTLEPDDRKSIGNEDSPTGRSASTLPSAFPSPSAAKSAASGSASVAPMAPVPQPVVPRFPPEKKEPDPFGTGRQ